MSRRGALLLAAVLALGFSPPEGEVLEWDARTLFDRAVGVGVRLSEDGGSVELEEGELFEDDGPAAGFSYKPNEEILTEEIRIKKSLPIPNPAARRATLLVGSRDPLQATINGKPAALAGSRTTGKYWTASSFDPALLEAGLNEIVLRGPGKIWIARDDEYASGSRTQLHHPNRSAKSTDRGASWVDERLGTAGNVDGEYYVRVYLDHYQERGALTLPVLDLGNLAGKPWGAPIGSIGPVRVEVCAETEEGGRVALRIRSGATADPRDKSWTDWGELSSAGTLDRPSGRFVQVSIRLSTSDPLRTPRVRAVRVDAAPEKLPDWTRTLKPSEVRNDEIVRTSIPFEYEPFGHPKLKALREKHGLDDVVKGATNEFDLIVRLAGWVAGRWQKSHLAERYPAWDALEILSSHADGAPVGGFCQQYNLVLLQACESFGLVGRAVSIGQGEWDGRIGGSGHEVVEIWSNDYRKWVYIDGNAGWYAVDSETAAPLSLWELRRRQLCAVRGDPHRPIRVVEVAKTRHRWKGLTDWPPFVELRLVPRSNFLEKTAPLPLHQGMRGWFWTGHQVWTDDEVSASRLYGNRVHRRGNFEWSVNQVHLVLEPMAAAGDFRVHLDTETPGFSTFLAEIDGTGRKPAESGFVWSLHPGKNRLEVRTRNEAGREGPESVVALERP
jgi:hypothetical protein